MGRMSVLATLFSVVMTQTAAAPPPKVLELNSIMMESTFKIIGPSAAAVGQDSLGTGFLIGRPSAADAKQLYYVLVTAAHVLDGIQGETATLILRVKTPTSPYERLEYKVRIRNGSRALWVQHPTSDVAVMYLGLPDNLASQPIPQDLLATDADFEKYEFHPGDEVFTVGYPYGLEANSFGFPVLRSGRIASYPLVPSATLKTFMVDFSVFGGNSGGPIFMNQLGRLYGNTSHFDERVFRILGLVSNQVTLTATGERLNVAGIVHAAFIRETIALLPPTPKAP